MKHFLAILSVSALLGGCASTSQVVPYGKDTYILSVSDAWGGHSADGLQVKAAQKANEYCTSQGKFVRVRNTSGSGTAGWTSTSSKLIFSCIDEGDPENTRPNLRRDADVVVERRD